MIRRSRHWLYLGLLLFFMLMACIVPIPLNMKFRDSDRDVPIEIVEDLKNDVSEDVDDHLVG